MTGAQFFTCIACTSGALVLAAITPAYEPDPVPMSWLETLAAHNCKPVGRMAGSNYRTVVYDCDDGTRVDP